MYNIVHYTTLLYDTNNIELGIYILKCIVRETVFITIRVQYVIEVF